MHKVAMPLAHPVTVRLDPPGVVGAVLQVLLGSALLLDEPAGELQLRIASRTFALSTPSAATDCTSGAKCN
jgi:hypothetical protein